MIRFETIHKSYGAKVALNHLDLTIAEPGVTGILGPNGSGKTTLVKLLLGLVHPTSGNIYLNGDKLNGDPAYRSLIGYLSQAARFPENLTVKEILELTEQLRGRASRKEELIELFKLEPYLRMEVRQLSGGNRQKLNLVNALMFDSPVLVLDEPTTGLDPVAVLALKELIRAEAGSGKIVLLTTHVLDLAESLMDRLVFLLEGQLHFNGPLNEFLNSTGAGSLELAMVRTLQPGMNRYEKSA